MRQAAETLKGKILNILKECSTILSKHDITVLLEEVDLAQKRLLQPMQLAIIGKISSSKSTLVNAILGEAEVVRTGQMEETFNVSWLKYGESDSDIKIVFKNGEITTVPRNEWAKWTSHQEKNTLKEKVKYIEVLYKHEILKEINIIDTPGLDALSQIDSKNTIAFLKEIHPDAVVMLFTKSIAESTMEVLQDFQGVDVGDFNISAMNAIGVLSKIDTVWSVMNAEKDVLETGKSVIKSTLYDKYPEVRKTLFSIYPVSALMGLSASLINENDYISLKCLSQIDDDILLEMLSSPDFFFDEDFAVGVESIERKRLYGKFGLYGIYLLIKTIRRNKDVSISFLAEVLREKSGFSKLFLTIQSHFGSRAILIKTQSILRNILHGINIAKLKYSGDKFAAISSVENLIVSTLLSLHEYKEWEYLSKYYDGKLEISQEIADEFISICGERGYSVIERLRCCDTNTPSDLVEIATQRALYWQKQYNIYSVIEPEKASFYKLLISSYNILLIDIKNALFEYEKAQEILQRSSSFLGLNHFKSKLS